MAEEETALKPPCTEPHAEQCRCPRSTTCRELRRRIAYLKSAVTQTDLQAAFFDLYSAGSRWTRPRRAALPAQGPAGTHRA
ncbi:MAG: hypothetical protein ACLTKG_00240 [Collinsella intestinalis]